MKMSEIRELSEADLQQQIEAARKELFECRFKHGLHQLENTAQMRQLKHRIAQMYTVLGQKQTDKAASRKATVGG